jgi:hypothetical protein
MHLQAVLGINRGRTLPEGGAINSSGKCKGWSCASPGFTQDGPRRTLRTAHRGIQHLARTRLSSDPDDLLQERH